MLTGLLDRSVLYGVRAEIEGLGRDVLEVCQFTRTAKHQDQVRPAHRDDRQFLAYRTPLREVPPGHRFPRHVFARAWAVQDAAEVELRLRWDRNPADRAVQLLTRQVGRGWAADDITDADLRGVGFWPPATLTVA